MAIKKLLRSVSASPSARSSSWDGTGAKGALGRGDRGGVSPLAASIRESHHGCLIPPRCIGGTLRGAFPEAGLLVGGSRIAAENGREEDDRMEVIGSEQRQEDPSFFKLHWEEETARRWKL